MDAKTTRKTKKELLDEIAERRANKRIEAEDVANYLKIQYDTLVEAGFNGIDAFELLTLMIKSAGKDD